MKQIITNNLTMIVPTPDLINQETLEYFHEQLNKTKTVTLFEDAEISLGDNANNYLNQVETSIQE